MTTLAPHWSPKRHQIVTLTAPAYAGGGGVLFTEPLRGSNRVFAIRGNDRHTALRGVDSKFVPRIPTKGGDVMARVTSGRRAALLALAASAVLAFGVQVALGALSVAPDNTGQPT